MTCDYILQISEPEIHREKHQIYEPETIKKINSIFDLFMESWIRLLQSKWSPKGFTSTLQETQSIHDTMHNLKIEFIAYT